MAGQAAPQQELLDRLVEGDFDPEEYDRQMAAAFGDDYYAAVGGLRGDAACGRLGTVFNSDLDTPWASSQCARPPACLASWACHGHCKAHRACSHLGAVAAVCRRARRRMTNWRTSCLRR